MLPPRSLRTKNGSASPFEPPSLWPIYLCPIAVPPPLERRPRTVCTLPGTGTSLPLRLPPDEYWPVSMPTLRVGPHIWSILSRLHSLRSPLAYSKWRLPSLLVSLSNSVSNDVERQTTLHPSTLSMSKKNGFSSPSRPGNPSEGVGASSTATISREVWINVVSLSPSQYFYALPSILVSAPDTNPANYCAAPAFIWPRLCHRYESGSQDLPRSVR